VQQLALPFAPCALVAGGFDVAIDVTTAADVVDARAEQTHPSLRAERAADLVANDVDFVLAQAHVSVPGAVASSHLEYIRLAFGRRAKAPSNEKGL